MSNLNIEPGSSTLEAMIASIELGVMMRTNVSWSIDDSRNKFQFGCEWGRMIRNGRLAEVVRDLYRSEAQPEQSYSERQLYEAALDRMTREIAVVDDVTETEALKKIEGQLAKSPRRAGKAEAEADADLEGDNDDMAEEAA